MEIRSRRVLGKSLGQDALVRDLSRKRETRIRRRAERERERRSRNDRGKREAKVQRREGEEWKEDGYIDRAFQGRQRDNREQNVLSLETRRRLEPEEVPRVLCKL